MPDNHKIFIDISINGQNYFVGTLWFSLRRGMGFSSFQYSEEWQANPDSFAIDPVLSPVHSKEVFYAGDKALFGCFEDAAPDRWGRMLMIRTNSDSVKNVGKHPRSLTDIDFLLMVDDASRMGAFRFRIDKEYLAIPKSNSIPPMIRLRELLEASEIVEDSKEARKLLLAPGSSLGGARPKAVVVSPENELYIAKFESSKDDWDIVRWEAVVLHLANQCDLFVPEYKIKSIPVSKKSYKSVLIEKRFDRQGYTRVPYISAMTLLNAKDNDSENFSFLHLSEKISEMSFRPKEDLLELWKRMVLGILISNTDNHLRNHGLIRTPEGWRLSPIFDINPNPEDRNFSLNIDFEGNSNIDKALDVVEYFEISEDQGKKIISDIVEIVTNWKNIARNYGLSGSDISNMIPAFKHADLDIALNMYN